MKNNFDNIRLWENTNSEQRELKKMLEFIDQTLFELQGFHASRKVLIKRRFEMFINSTDEETDNSDSGWGV